jgi:hypothetical protein
MPFQILLEQDVAELERKQKTAHKIAAQPETGCHQFLHFYTIKFSKGQASHGTQPGLSGRIGGARMGVATGNAPAEIRVYQSDAFLFESRP